MSMDDYGSFLASKSHLASMGGFEPLWLPSYLHPLQRHAADWAIRKGRAATFLDCGLGKSLSDFCFAENAARKTGKPSLIVAPLGVLNQTAREGHRFNIDCEPSRDGKIPSRITLTNYERLHHFDPEDFGCLVCAESSIIKNYQGATRKEVTRFLTKLPYRLLSTATAAPNDWDELGTSSEALGELTHSEMLRRFFAYCDDKTQRREAKKQQAAEELIAARPSYFKKLAYRVSQTIGQWRLKHHAITDFWRWVASWAIAARKPSDLGYSDEGFSLPPLTENLHTIAAPLAPGMLYPMPAIGLHAERQECRRALKHRCEKVAELVDHDRPAVVWCDHNDEGDLLVKTVPGAQQIAGKTKEDRRIELYDAFGCGQLRVIVIKRRIGAWGLNWQHCNHVVAFETHSFEQYYQALRRCWRYGQKNPVTLDTVATEGQVRVTENRRAKARRMDLMFGSLVAEMRQATRVEREDLYTGAMEVPSWL